MTVFTRLVWTAILWTCFLSLPVKIQACIDSLSVHVVPVQCHGLRNGEIQIERVHGGDRPYYFSIDGLNFSTRPVFTRLWAGTYYLYVRDSLGCSFKLKIEVTEPPLLQVQLGSSSDTVLAGSPVLLSALVWPDTCVLNSISWRPPYYITRQDTLRQQLFPIETTTFAIEVVDRNGCTARDQVTVVVPPIEVYIPNVFRPGSTENSFFTVFADEDVAQVQLLQIYSRNGGLIFERSNFEHSNPLLGWTGRWKGKYVNPGVFLWRCIVEYKNGKFQQFTGSVTVLY